MIHQQRGDSFGSSGELNRRIAREFVLMKMKMCVALLLATVSGTSATADLIGDTYVINAFSFGDVGNAALIEGYRGTFDGNAEVIGANPLGNAGDQLVVFEDVQVVAQTGNRFTFDVSLILAAVDSADAFTDMLAVDVDALIGEPATGIVFNLGFAEDPVTGEVDPLSALLANGTNYVLEGASSSIFTADDEFGLGFVSPPTFDDGLHFAGVSGSIDGSSLQQRGFVAMSQTYRYSVTVPEPSSFAAFGVLGICGLVFQQRKRRANSTQQL